MDDGVIRKFAEAMLYFEPDMPMSATEIELRIRTHGLEGFIQKAGCDAAELAETAELLARLSDGGASR